MRWAWVVLLALLLALQYQFWLGDGGVRDAWRLESTVAGQKAENEGLRRRNDALEAEVRDLKTGLDAVQERARSELGMIKDGEVFYQVVEEQ